MTTALLTIASYAVFLCVVGLIYNYCQDKLKK